MKRYLQSFIDLLFPKSCTGCKMPLRREEPFLCIKCELELPINPELAQHDNEVKHVFDGRLPLIWGNAFLQFTKNGIAQSLIHNLKYKAREDLGFELGLRFGTHVKSVMPAKPDLIIPVPLHPTKQRSRGYNQCFSIAYGLAQALDVEVQTDVLLRIRPNPSQTKLNRARRWENVEGIFSLQDGERVTGKHILLVDDTLTTGSTLESCGTELLKIRAIKLSLCTLAYAK